MAQRYLWPLTRWVPLLRTICIAFIVPNILLLQVFVASSAWAAQLPRHRVDVLPFSFSPPSADFDVIPSTAKEVFGSFDSAAGIIPFDALLQTLVLDASDLDTTFSFSFMPEIGRNISEYSFEVDCSNHGVLRDEDVLLGPPVLMENGRANYTVSVDFERSVGESDLTVLFRRQDRSEYARLTVHYIICGLSFFYIDKKNGSKSLVRNNEFRIPSYEQLLYDDLLLFYTFIQFPDGSTSESALTDHRSLPDLSTMKITIEGNALLSAHSFATCLSDHAFMRPNGTITLEKACSFGFTKLGAAQRLYFTVRLSKYRTGGIRFHFLWDAVLRETVFEDVFETSLGIRVIGSAPPALISITPRGPFRKSGGQFLECAVINSSPQQKFNLIIRNTSISPASAKTSPEGWTIFSFITPKGIGKNIPWDLTYSVEGASDQLSCLWAGDLDRFVFNYLEEDIAITSLNPNFGPIVGGTMVTCEGFFGSFNPSNASGDVILLGSYPLEKEYIASISDTSLVFKLPPMQVVQASTFEIGCTVIAHGIRSNEVKFTYESLTETTIGVLSGSYEEKIDTYMIPVCGSSSSSSGESHMTLFADVNKGAPLASLAYQWRVVVMTTKTEVITFSGPWSMQSFLLDLSKLSINETYEATVVVSDERYNTQVTASIRLQPTKSKRLGVGLSLDYSRSIALPPIDARMTATVTELGECYGRNKKLSYDWTFLSVTKTLTSTSTEVDITIPSPRRLGREYMIPSHALEYGKHKVTVKVYYTHDRSTYGVASTWLRVEPAPLQAMIGSGESIIRVSGSSSLEMTAGLSYDPDTFMSGSSHALSFEWRCDVSTGGNERFTSVVACPDDLLPYPEKESFTVESTTLRSFRFTNETTYIRYSLYARKSYKGVGIRSSARVSQVVEILPTNDVLAPRGSISISSTDGRPVHLNDVPFYDTFVLSPTGPAGTSWRFRLVEPANESFTFLNNPNHLLTLPGFYAANEFLAGRRSLGLREGVLQPDSVYSFEVEYESSSAQSTSVVEVQIRTMPKPTVTFLPFSRTLGSPATVFSAVAMPSLENYAFKFYFHVKMSDGSEMCIDGCSGQRKVSFRLPTVGNHTVRCTMVDARGKYVIDRAKDVYTLTIQAKNVKEPALMAQSDSLQTSFDMGDHSGFEMESIHLAAYAKTVSLNDTLTSEMVAELVAKTVEKLANLYRKTQPCTTLAKDYMVITSSFASIPVGYEAMSSLETFYNLCQMMYYAVQNTPASERYDLADELTATFTQLTGHARQLFARGSSRVRLLAEDGAAAERQGGQVNEALLELSEMTVPLTARVMTRDVPCGFVGMSEVGGMATVSVAALCTKEHGNRLQGRHAMMEWCDDVYEDDGRKQVVFALGEFDDYIGESGVLSMRRAVGRGATPHGSDPVPLDTGNMPSHGYVLTKTMVVEADSPQADARAAAAGMTHADSGMGGGTCFTVVQDVRPTAALFAGYEEVACGRATAVEYTGVKRLGEALAGGGRDYAERAVRSVALVGRAEREAEEGGAVRVAARLAKVSGRTFGAKRGQCVDLRPKLFGQVAGVWLPVMALLAVLVGVVGLGIAGVAREAKKARQVVWADGGDAPYIERDVYGRDLGIVDAGQLDLDGAVDGDEQVVFESPRVLAGGVRVRDGREVSSLFRDDR